MNAENFNILNYLAEQTAQKLPKEQKVINLINEADILNNEYQLLHKAQFTKDIGFTMMHKHQADLSRGGKNAAPETVFNKVQQNSVTHRKIAIQEWLDKLHIWSLKGYKVIVSLRKMVTGQELVYHVQDTQNHYSYHLDENQYLQLLASNKISASKYWGEIQKAVKKGAPLGDIFKLNVHGTQGNIEKAQKSVPGGDIVKIDLKKDELYKHLVEQKFIQTSGGKPNHSRLYELYDQLVARYDWKKEGSSITFLTEHRKQMVDLFIKKYKEEGLHKDNTAFYKTGDAIADENTLIENKVGNAVVSISTIRRAIEEIAKLKPFIDTSVESLKKGLIKIFTYKGSKALTEMIQKGAYEKAIKSINELFKI